MAIFEVSLLELVLEFFNPGLDRSLFELLSKLSLSLEQAFQRILLVILWAGFCSPSCLAPKVRQK